MIKQRFHRFFIVFLFILFHSIHAEAHTAPHLRKLKEHRKPYQYQLAAVAIFQDEAQYLPEWIEFHRLMGVQHFYLFNNLSIDQYKALLQPYIKEGLVDLIEWPYSGQNLKEWNPIQCSAYEYALRLTRHRVKWVAFLDVDEFLFPTRANNLLEFLSGYEDCSGITANWVMFGTSWVPKIPSNKLLIEMLRLRGPENLRGNTHVKSIVRPERVRGCNNPHFFIYLPGFHQVNADKVPFQGPFSPYIALDKIRINHYWSRDEYYLNAFKIPRQKKWDVDTTHFSEFIQLLNQETDETILRFAPRLREIPLIK